MRFPGEAAPQKQEPGWVVVKQGINPGTPQWRALLAMGCPAKTGSVRPVQQGERRVQSVIATRGRTTNGTANHAPTVLRPSKHKVYGLTMKETAFELLPLHITIVLPPTAPETD